MLVEPVLITKESLKKADWKTINGQLSELFDGNDGLIKFVTFLQGSKKVKGVVKPNHLDEVLLQASKHIKCVKGIIVDLDNVFFI